MIQFNKDIFPTRMSFERNSKDLVYFENGDIKQIATIEKDTEISVSFSLKLDEFIEFESFFKNINNGLDDFTAFWRGSEEKYTISSDLNIKYPFGDIEFFDISFTAFLKLSICSKETYNLISEIEKNINLLKGNSNYYKSLIECYDLTKLLNIEVEKNINILKGV